MPSLPAAAPPRSSWSDPRLFTCLRHSGEEVHPNTITAFETDLFRGRLVPLVRRCATGTFGGAPPPYFQRRSSLSAFFVQGTVTRRVPFAEALTGQVFERPFKHMPNRFLVNAGVALVRRHLSPDIRGDPLAQRPHLLAPLVTIARCVHVAMPARADVEAVVEAVPPPSLEAIGRGEVDETTLEDTRALGGVFATARMAAAQRRAYLSVPGNLRGRYLEPGVVYTFGFWQSLFEPTDFTVRLPYVPVSVPVSRYLDRQPLCILCRQGVGGGDLWCVDLWHRTLVADDAEPVT
jgi:hypothetical protein